MKIQRLEAGIASKGGCKKKSKRKREEQVLDTGQKRIVDSFLKKAEADLNREAANIKNQGAGNSCLVGASGNGLSCSTPNGDTKAQSEESGGLSVRKARKGL